MNEIERSARIALLWRQSRAQSGIINYYEWCVYIGLWETSNWITDSNE